MTKVERAQVDPRALQYLIQRFNSPERPSFRWACEELRRVAEAKGWGSIPSDKVLKRLMRGSLNAEVVCRAPVNAVQKSRLAEPAAQIRAMAGLMVQLRGEGVLQALLDARNLITARAKDLIADPNFGSDSHA